MQPYPHATPLTATIILAGTVLVLAVSLALITATMLMLSHLDLPRITIPTAF